MKWLKLKGEEHKAALITIAQAKRREIQDEQKKQAAAVLESKLEQRSKALDKVRIKHIKHQQLVKDLMTYDLITTVEQLNRRVASIVCLSIPKVVKETEIKEMVKRQVMIRKHVHNQKGIAIPSTLRGKPKPVDQLLADLKQVLCQHVHVQRTASASSGHQQLYTIFDRPSLLVGVKIKHQFEEDGSLTWYKGIITRYNKQNFFVHYDTEENCVFTFNDLKEDFLSGDLWIL